MYVEHRRDAAVGEDGCADDTTYPWNEGSQPGDYQVAAVDELVDDDANRPVFGADEQQRRDTIRQGGDRRTRHAYEFADVSQHIVAVGESENPLVISVHHRPGVGKQRLFECAARHTEDSLTHTYQQDVHGNHR